MVDGWKGAQGAPGKLAYRASREAGNSREAVETRIKTQNLFDSVLFHDGQVDGVTRGHLGASHHDLFCALGCGPVDGQYLIGDS